jgi:hypothetical protein
MRKTNFGILFHRENGTYILAFSLALITFWACTCYPRDALATCCRHTCQGRSEGDKSNMYTCIWLLCVWGGGDGGGMNVAMYLLTAHADERCNHSSRYYPLSMQRRWTYHTDKNQSYYSIIYIHTNYQKLCKYSSTVTITCSFHYLKCGTYEDIDIRLDEDTTS